MGNCCSSRKVVKDTPITNSELDTLKSSKYIKISENLHLTYTEDHMLINKEGHYGVKIYYGRLSSQQILLKLIDSDEQEQMEWEEGMLSTLSHENIARIFYPLKISGNKFILVMEFVGKNLKELVGNLDEMEMKVIMYQLACVVSYLQELQIAHLGLAPQNVYVLENSGNLIVKLINFNNAQRFDSFYDAFGCDCFFDGFSAPEVMQEFTEKSAYTTSDIYSLGCLFFMIVTGGFQMIQIKYSNQLDSLAARMKIIKNDTSFKILCTDLIKKMLIFEPNKRISHFDVKNHPSFWTAKHSAEFIIDTAILIEKDAKYFEFLTTNGNFVIDSDWTENIEEIVMKVIREIRQISKKSSDVNYKSAGYLVKIIRNSLVHSIDDRLVEIMGTDKQDLMNYWISKFPQLICFLYNSKIEYERRCQIYFTK